MDPLDSSTPARFPVVVFADYICPWSYALIDVVDRLEVEYGLVAMWRPHLLHPEVPPDGAPYPAGTNLEATIAWFRDVAPEAAARMRFPGRLHHSFLAFEATECASDLGVGDAYRRAVFDALWADGADIGDVAVLQRLATDVGLDGDAVGGALRAGTYAERTLARVAQTLRLGVTATPTLILGTLQVNGWHYYEALQSAVERQGVRMRAETPLLTPNPHMKTE